jgi:hypothetical protein
MSIPGLDLIRTWYKNRQRMTEKVFLQALQKGGRGTRTMKWESPDNFAFSQESPNISRQDLQEGFLVRVDQAMSLSNLLFFTWSGWAFVPRAAPETAHMICSGSTLQPPRLAHGTVSPGPAFKGLRPGAHDERGRLWYGFMEGGPKGIHPCVRFVAPEVLSQAMNTLFMDLDRPGATFFALRPEELESLGIEVFHASPYYLDPNTIPQAGEPATPRKRL